MDKKLLDLEIPVKQEEVIIFKFSAEEEKKE